MKRTYALRVVVRVHLGLTTVSETMPRLLPIPGRLKTYKFAKMEISPLQIMEFGTIQVLISLIKNNQTLTFSAPTRHGNL